MTDDEATRKNDEMLRNMPPAATQKTSDVIFGYIWLSLNPPEQVTPALRKAKAHELRDEIDRRFPIPSI